MRELPTGRIKEYKHPALTRADLKGLYRSARLASTPPRFHIDNIVIEDDSDLDTVPTDKVEKILIHAGPSGERIFLTIRPTEATLSFDDPSNLESTAIFSRFNERMETVQESGPSKLDRILTWVSNGSLAICFISQFFLPVLGFAFIIVFGLSMAASILRNKYPRRYIKFLDAPKSKTYWARNREFFINQTVFGLGVAAVSAAASNSDRIYTFIKYIFSLVRL